MRRRQLTECVVGALLLAWVHFAMSQSAPGQSSGFAGASVQSDSSPDVELRTGTALTREGKLGEAIPHLIAARRSGSNSFATGFNLAICYVGTGNYKKAIGTLEELQASGNNSAALNNLLAQAYIGDGRTKRALESFNEAVSQTPKDEKLYVFIADACTDHQDYLTGLEIVEKGLDQLPESARLHYERGLFLARVDRLEEAKPEFDRAVALGQGSYISSLAAVQKYLYDDKYPEAIRLLREEIKAGREDYQIDSLLGTVLMKQGAAPGDPEFSEAKAALEAAANSHPNYSATQIALGKVYAMEGRNVEAVKHLEAGRRLEPDNPEVYTGLAMAYQHLGDMDKARECHAQLKRLLDLKTNSRQP